MEEIWTEPSENWITLTLKIHLALESFVLAKTEMVHQLEAVAHLQEDIGQEVPQEVADLHQEAAGLHQEGADLHQEGADLHQEGADLHQEGADLLQEEDTQDLLLHHGSTQGPHLHETEGTRDLHHLKEDVEEV